MSYNKIDGDILTKFSSFLANEQIITDNEIILKYSKDKTEDFIFPPEIVLIPSTREEVSQIAKTCNESKIPLTVRSKGTGLSGGALPIRGGVLISMEKFNKILEVDTKNFQVTVEPYVINFALQQKVKEYGLFYPPDPSSYKICSIGGNLAENSGGPKAVKYGTTKDYVLSLEVVLPDGSIIHTGRSTLKNVSDYNLTQLIIGSEGTLGIITKATLRLIPLPKYDELILISFYSLEDAANAVNTILNMGIVPSGLEVMERNALFITQKEMGIDFPKVTEKTEAHLLVELDGNYSDILKKEMQLISKAVKECNNPEEIITANSAEEKTKLWKLRRSILAAVYKTDVFKEEDVVVPRSYLPDAIKYIKSWGTNYGYIPVCYGHAGDGNIHVNILKANCTEKVWNTELKNHLKELFDKICNDYSGAITGEHGVGYVQKDFMPIMHEQKALELMKGIKKLFDPNNILNPEKMFS